jgi:hypothetical protein
VDSLNKSHILYGGKGLKYARQNGYEWETLSISNETPIFRGISLVLDDSSMPKAIYIDAEYLQLDYAKYDGIRWEIETVDNYSYVGIDGTSIALDSKQAPHIAYDGGQKWVQYDPLHNKLHYARRTDNAWILEAINQNFNVQGPSLLLDGSDLPYISYSAEENLKYLWKDNGKWYIDVVDTQEGTRNQTSLILDRLGKPHISYYAGGSIRYAEQDDSTWYIQHVENAYGELYTFLGTPVSMILDKKDFPHLFYFGGTEQNIVSVNHAWYDGVNWRVNKIDEITSWPNCYTIDSAIDRNGKIHVVYYDDSVIKYAWKNDETWNIEDVDVYIYVDYIQLTPYARGCRGLTIAIDSSNQPHLAFNYLTLVSINYQNLLANLIYIWKDDDLGWAGELVDTNPVLYGYYHLSLELDNSDWPHISYVIPDINDVLYATRHRYQNLYLPALLKKP